MPRCTHCDTVIVNREMTQCYDCRDAQLHFVQSGPEVEWATQEEIKPFRTHLHMVKSRAILRVTRQ